jgi:hypothetical protein
MLSRWRWRTWYQNPLSKDVVVTITPEVHHREPSWTSSLEPPSSSMPPQACI